MQKFPLIILLFLISMIPRVALAEFSISEIMYDLEGGDDGREWVEVVNTGSGALDLSTYKFREGDTNHALTLIQGEVLVPAGGYALIVDDPQKFLLDHPSVSAAVFDSSFSLSNTGEVLSIRNSSLVDVDSVSYSSESGANGDGNSLQKNGGLFTPALPTPGSAFSGVVASNNNSSANTSSQSSSSNSSTSSVAPENEITADAGVDRSAVVGADTVFEGVVYGKDKKPIENVRLLWNFGDGATAEGRKVLHAFRYPGTYVVALSVSVVKVGVGDYVTVTAYEPSIRLTVMPGKDGYTEIENAGAQRLDISLWRLTEGSAFFFFPEGTFILPKNKVRFANAVTLLSGLPSLTLLYPNGVPTSVLAAVPSTSVSTIQSVPKTAVAPKPKAPPRPAVAAAAGLSQKEEIAIRSEKAPNNFWPTYGWYVALAGLVIVGGLGMVFLRRRGETKSLADEFEIVE